MKRLANILLKPCPFCERKAVYGIHDSTRVEVACTDFGHCGARIIVPWLDNNLIAAERKSLSKNTPFATYQSRLKHRAHNIAAGRWNRRAPPVVRVKG
jgi:Restriction alleviation protein Lar